MGSFLRRPVLGWFLLIYDGHLSHDNRGLICDLRNLILKERLC